MNVNQAAFITVTGLALGTGAAIFAAATVTSVAATVAYVIFATLGAALSIASITAWAISQNKDGAEAYFERFKEHAAKTLPGMLQFVVQMCFQALISGIAEGIVNKIRRKISGPDLVVDYL